MRANSYWQWAERDPARPGLVTLDGEILSFGELGARDALGMQRGNHLALIRPNAHHTPCQRRWSASGILTTRPGCAARATG